MKKRVYRAIRRCILNRWATLQLRQSFYINRLIRFTHSIRLPQHSMEVRYLRRDAPQIKRLKECAGESKLSAEDFVEAVEGALDILQKYRGQDYRWIIRHISYIGNLPTPSADHYYSVRQNAFLFDFYRSGFTRSENTPIWNRVWLAATMEYLYVQARLCRACPHAVFAEPERASALCRKAARRLTEAISETEEIYDFSTMF